MNDSEGSYEWFGDLPDPASYTDVEDPEVRDRTTELPKKLREGQAAAIFLSPFQSKCFCNSLD